MKKLLLALVAALACLGMQAQNANRTGFFIEAAVGGTTGSSPRVALSYDGSTVSQYFASGASFNISFGPRMRTSNHVAFDLRFEVQSPFSYVSSVPVLKFMPAVRYTSKEIFGNMSIYATVGVGGAIGAGYKSFYSEWNWSNDTNSHYGYFNQILNADGEKVKLTLGDSDPAVAAGVSYTINVGLNITSHFYAGLMWDAQYMFSQPGKDGKDTCHWGMTGVQIGYRF